MDIKDCYTLGDLKKYIKECELPDSTPICIETQTLDNEDGGSNCELMSMTMIGENDGRAIAFIGHKDSLSNKQLETIWGA